jgi:hypothetical protein
MSREETLATWEKFEKVGWRPLNYKPATTKNITYGKSLWNRYVPVAAIFTVLCHSAYFCPRVLRYCEHVGVAADPYLLESGPGDFEA